MNKQTSQDVVGLGDGFPRPGGELLAYSLGGQVSIKYKIVACECRLVCTVILSVLSNLHGSGAINR